MRMFQPAYNHSHLMIFSVGANLSCFCSPLRSPVVAALKANQLPFLAALLCDRCSLGSVGCPELHVSTLSFDRKMARVTLKSDFLAAGCNRGSFLGFLKLGDYRSTVILLHVNHITRTGFPSLPTSHMKQGSSSQHALVCCNSSLRSRRSYLQTALKRRCD